jgi:hypothetical protein
MYVCMYICLAPMGSAPKKVAGLKFSPEVQPTVKGGLAIVTFAQTHPFTLFTNEVGHSRLRKFCAFQKPCRSEILTRSPANRGRKTTDS